MRNHSQRKRNSAAHDGGDAAPSLGRSPRGAKNSEMNAASSSMPSDWYDAKSCAAPTNDKNASDATAIDPRGQRLNSSAIDAASPATTSTHSAALPDEIHSSVGAYQKRAKVVSPSRSVAR